MEKLVQFNNEHHGILLRQLTAASPVQNEVKDRGQGRGRQRVGVDKGLVIGSSLTALAAFRARAVGTLLTAKTTIITRLGTLRALATFAAFGALAALGRLKVTIVSSLEGGRSNLILLGSGYHRCQRGNVEE